MSAPVEPALPTIELRVRSVLGDLLAWPPVEAVLPLPLLGVALYLLYRLARETWAELDREARRERAARPDPDAFDARPLAALSLTAAVLTVQQYFGGRAFHRQVILPWLTELEGAGVTFLRTEETSSLSYYAWWALTRIVGYTLVPVLAWRWLFPRERLADMGLRLRGAGADARAYGALLLVVLVPLLLAGTQDGFLRVYPFYRGASRSWFDLLAWEVIYLSQFVALEFFFRGWLLAALRPALGSAAIFVMAVPYCMIHFGKPYLEAHGALLAGVALGTLALRTRSIYGGVVVHVTVALSMDLLSLTARGAFPTRFWPELW